jgi:hypothetical protein
VFIPFLCSNGLSGNDKETQNKKQGKLERISSTSLLRRVAGFGYTLLAWAGNTNDWIKKYKNSPIG